MLQDILMWVPMDIVCLLMIKTSKAHLLELKSCAKHRMRCKPQRILSSCIAKIYLIIKEVIRSSNVTTMAYTSKINPLFAAEQALQ